MFKRKLFIALTLILFWLTPVWSHAQSIPIDTINLKRQATEMADAFMNADYKTLVKYTYTKVVEMMGGEKQMTDILDKSISEMKAQGYSFKSVQIGLTNQRVKAGKEIHALVLQTLVMSVPGGTLTAPSYLLAISADGGKQWHFIDTAPLSDKAKLKSILPHFNPALKIPNKPQPIFVESK